MQPIRKQVFAFTSKHPTHLNVLKNDIIITEAFDPKSGLPAPVEKQFIGIWDTGASGSVINSRVVNELNLKPSGKMWCHAVGDKGLVNKYLADTYSINIGLPNKVVIMGVVAAKGEIGGGDVLIGMDVIGIGDFAVTNTNNKTTWSFRTPSVQEIDFVKGTGKDSSLVVEKISRNDPCPCGSGKKYKRCHGL